MNETMMKCGHTANGKTADGKLCCVICDCYEVASEKPSLAGRMAKCGECNNTKKSDWNLPFFHYIPNLNCDTFYCGCHGWE